MPFTIPPAAPVGWEVGNRCSLSGKAESSLSLDWVLNMDAFKLSQSVQHFPIYYDRINPLPAPSVAAREVHREQ